MATILLVEDDPEQRRATARLLRMEAHEVIEAETAEVGLAMATRLRPDLMICDVQLPGMSGVQLLQLLRANREMLALPVLMLTAMGSRENVRTGMTLGADDYLTKPASWDELQAAVKALLAKRQRQRDHDLGTLRQHMQQELDRHKQALAEQFDARLMHEFSLRWDQARTSDKTQQTLPAATLLLIDMFAAVNLPGLAQAEHLAAAREKFESARDTLLLFGAQWVLPCGNDLLGIFPDGPKMALRAAGGLRAQARTPLVLHHGPATLLRLTDPMHGGDSWTLATGQTLHEAAHLLNHARAARWSMGASKAVLDLLPPGLGRGADRVALEVAGRAGPLLAAELTSAISAAPAPG